uniref:SSD domain-containing protein n=1 Tax=Anopheles culicifacies TaxID=139723 RepID=A0A182MDC6_9DIPT
MPIKHVNKTLSPFWGAQDTKRTKGNCITSAARQRGIGIDDTFVMLAAWRRTSVKLSVPERMGHMMSEAAVSITITSLTDMISFWIGILSPFPSVQIFCAYSGFAVCFTYLWHITFFAGCMAVSGHCEFKNLHAIFGYKVLPESVAIKGAFKAA